MRDFSNNPLRASKSDELGSTHFVQARPLLLSLTFALAVLLPSACSPAESIAKESTRSQFVSLTKAHPAFDIAGLIRKVERNVAEGDPVGSELLIFEHNKPIYHQAWGALDREKRIPWTADTICRIRTLSKPLLATAILMLLDRGRLTINDPIHNYLPEFDVERWGKFTVAELLSENGGPVYKGKLRPFDNYSTLSELVLDIAARGPEPKGVNRHRLPGTNYNVLGLLLERVSGVSAEEFMRTQIFKPLGMKDTYCDYRTRVSWRDRLATTYERTSSGLGFKRDKDSRRNSQPRYFAPYDGVFSTAKDYSRFMLFWQNRGFVEGRKFLSPTLIDAAQRMYKDDVARPGAHNFAWELYGFPELDSKLPAPYGHTGHDESVVLVSPVHKLTFIYFTQSRGGKSVAAFTTEVAEFLRTKQKQPDSMNSSTEIRSEKSPGN